MVECIDTVGGPVVNAHGDNCQRYKEASLFPREQHEVLFILTWGISVITWVQQCREGRFPPYSIRRKLSDDQGDTYACNSRSKNTHGRRLCLALPRGRMIWATLGQHTSFPLSCSRMTPIRRARIQRGQAVFVMIDDRLCDLGDWLARKPGHQHI